MNIYSILPWVGAVASLVILALLLRSSSKTTESRRLAELSEQGNETPEPIATDDADKFERAKGRSIDQVADAKLKKEEAKKHLRNRLVQAGLYSKQALFIFHVARVATFLTPLLIGFFAASMEYVTLPVGLAIGGFISVVGTLAPSFYLDHLKRSRQTRVRRALPDALDLLMICLAGGASLSSAISRVAHELSTAHRGLALELAIVERETHLGLSTGEAMRSFANRYDLEELRSLAAVINQAERFGSSISQALEVYADTLRTRRSQHAEEKAQKAVVKVIFPTLFFIFPAIFIVVIGPAVINIYKAISHGMLK
jgi:tight adherence protein C